MGGPADDKIPHFGQQSPHKGLLPVDAPAGDNIVIPLVQLVQQKWNICWVILPIRIKCDDQIAVSVIEPGGKSRSLSEIAPKPDHLDAIICSAQAQRHVVTVVRTAIVNIYDLKINVMT